MRVALLCPGLGRAYRGYERFASDLFDAVREHADVTLFRGPGDTRDGVVSRPALHRDGMIARTLGRISHDRYYWEAVSFAYATRGALGNYDLLHYSEPPLNLAFTRFDRRSRDPVRRLFTHSLNMDAEHTIRCHHIHQTSPTGFRNAESIGVPAERMTLLPFGVNADDFRPADDDARAAARRLHGLPLNQPIVLCAAAINSAHKRVDKLIAAIASLEVRPHLVLCGSPEEPALLEQGRVLLGAAGITHLYMQPAEMRSVYAAADCLVLPSLVEGFGLVTIEAQLCGLPVIVNEGEHFRWVLSSGEASFADMSSHESLANAITSVLAALQGMIESSRTRRSEVAARFDWRSLAPRYAEMYAVAGSHPPATIEAILAH